MDIESPIKTSMQPEGSKSIATFDDDFSRYTKEQTLKHESGECLSDYLETKRSALGKNGKVNYIHADRGTEFTGGEFKEVMRQKA